MEPTDRTAARVALPLAAARLAELLRRSDPDAPVAGSDWRVADVATHLGFVLQGFTEAATGSSARFARYVPDEPDFHHRLATVNAALIREFTETATDLDQTEPPSGIEHRIEQRIEQGIAGFLEATEALAPDVQLETPWYGPGVTRTPDTLTALALGELLVHGLDIARTSRAPWPIERADAAVVAREVFARMLPLMLSDTGRAATVSYRISFRGTPRGTPDLVVRLDAGTVTTGPAAPGERVDCRIWADPVAFLLVGYGRTPTWRQALAGRIVAFGRRPWIAARLPQLFCRP